mmetsp:Transcript_8767/g.12986  ORF Transcript_8767/g.12986 Transcript_8767/m.12986 type:complete len:589 (+) Transcript_8767:72-1838(+)|eukprot:CAMPEP_0117425906 /NCGR_PEP_ID=MMETSP0758-20121206/6122_1 /TAXON_ID=63605 /ORGANISM="Percolomonas cosmopolitus, Strain AE-1 (ATCC 50343)" /LENGTH=588 /DNA_ID=CAMNT_0005210747 /DNA_START=105 /DNA_END=1871 /DNA_ORIENTATION=+
MGQNPSTNWSDEKDPLPLKNHDAMQSKSSKTKKEEEAMEKVDTFIVLMLENRSFDSIMGYLYTKEEMKNNPQLANFEGVVGKNISNPVPKFAQRDGEPTTVPVHPYSNVWGPDPDPGEIYSNVNTQLYSTVNPETNRFKDPKEMLKPYNSPYDDKDPSMKGFVEDYINHFHVEITGKEGDVSNIPSYEKYKDVMGSYTPEVVPVISKLAKEFAVFDHWHCSVPSQTFCNRSFFHAASSSGRVMNNPYWDWAISNADAKTFYEQLDENNISWAIYYDESQVMPAELLIHMERLTPFFESNFKTMSSFYDDIKNGTLPTYCFIEPRLLYNYNNYHPPVRIKGWEFLPSNVLNGEILVANVYDAIRNSPKRDNILFTITFDEHGGLHDHVPPPKTVPPKENMVGQQDFKFDRLGVRVPTIMISSWTKKNSLVSNTLQHSSFISSLRKKKLNIEEDLTDRDKYAPIIPFDDVLSRDTPRTAPDYPAPGDPNVWPTVTPRKNSVLSHDKILKCPTDGLGKGICLGFAGLVDFQYKKKKLPYQINALSKEKYDQKEKIVNDIRDHYHRLVKKDVFEQGEAVELMKKAKSVLLNQ